MVNYYVILGIFVQSITPDSPADIDGRIQPGDRIIAINGQSLEGMPHHVAVDLMRKSHKVVQLMISQGSYLKYEISVCVK